MNGDSRDMPGHRPVVALTTTDMQRLARRRVRAMDRRCRIARMAEQAMPLTRYYGPRPLLVIPLAEYLERRWAA
jgi:hypothetical protein